MTEFEFGIMNVFARYSRAIDESDWRLLDEVFDENSTLTTAVGVEVVGRANIETVLRAMTQYRQGAVLHQPFNIEVETEGDAATAQSNWLYLGRRRPDASWQILAAGRYADRLRRTADGWRFASRVIYNFDFPDRGSMAQDLRTYSPVGAPNIAKEGQERV